MTNPAVTNPTVDVQKFGQSLWYDNIRRDMFESGQLQALLADYGVLGVTSNPTIFEKAIAESDLYDETVKSLLHLDANEIFDNVAMQDIRAAADLLLPIYERTHAIDGYVSLEVSPLLADDSLTTLSEAKRLFKLIDRPNVMIKIAGTPAGLPAIEEALFAGINVNVTLIFSVANYVAVAERYIKALERRLAAGLPIDRIASVASFFISRIDTLVDMQLENNIRSAQGRDLDRVSANRQFLGKIAIASAKVAYKRFKELFRGERFAKLETAGARPQRISWASTGVKNAAYPDTLYVTSLVGSDTVNTVPHKTLLAFRDHGSAAPTLDDGLDEAQSLLNKLPDVGVDFDLITKQLQDDGLEDFVDSFRKLITRVEGKRKFLSSGFIQRQDLVLGMYKETVEKELNRLRQQLTITRTWQQDATLWKLTPDHARSISSRLDWLSVATDGRIDRARLAALRSSSKHIGWKHVVLIGMGGSSLAAEVLWKTFGQQADFPALIVLDSTDPAAIEYVNQTVDLDTTLFVVASKSGTTIELVAMQQYFYAKYAENAGQHFIAITDPGSPLEQAASSLKFRDCLLNPPDIGGRFSALSYFGMAPAALLGLDIDQIIDRGAEMQQASAQGVLGHNHPGLWLGTIMGVLTTKGRDKLTIITSPEIAGLGDWIEHLIAGSTGKEGKGVIPVTGATVGMPHDYDDDRLLVYIRLNDGAPEATNSLDAEVQRLVESGQPIITLRLRDKFDIGAEFFRWEFGAAVAGMLMQINPFDEPNVTESKLNTQRLLHLFEQEGNLPVERPALTEGQVSLFADPKLAKLLGELAAQHNYGASELAGVLAAYFSMARSGDYIALLTYARPSESTVTVIEAIRRRLRHTFKRAVTVGFGPRYLHSTGQLHKGGPNTGFFVLITAEAHTNPPIAGLPYGFATLIEAQALGDYQSLQSKDRRVVRLHIAGDLAAGLKKLLDAVAAAADKRK